MAAAEGEVPEDEEPLDPRVEGELMALNKAMADVNEYERGQESIKAALKKEMEQLQEDLGMWIKRLGKKAIERARPYHEALFEARKAHYGARQAALHYERAITNLKRAKAIVSKAESRLQAGEQFDPRLQQQLNKGTVAVMEGEKRKRQLSEIHSQRTQAFLEADTKLMTIAKSRKKIILKTQPYFESREKHNRSLLKMKTQLQKGEKAIQSAKARVAHAMQQLESISNEIHDKRKQAADSKPQAAVKGQERLRKEIEAADAQLKASRKRSEIGLQEAEEARAHLAMLEGLPDDAISGDSDAESDVSEMSEADADVEKMVHRDQSFLSLNVHEGAAQFGLGDQATDHGASATPSEAGELSAVEELEAAHDEVVAADAAKAEAEAKDEAEGTDVAEAKDEADAEDEAAAPGNEVADDAAGDATASDADPPTETAAADADTPDEQ
eukprot:m.78423 g.78423  ORF g.78423 m.78423 type:complete len:443 (+) comp14585_c0_seq1:125-1453(+)